MLLENILGGIAFITTVVGMLPQLYKSFQTKSTRDISMAMLINCIICSAAWIGYSVFSDSYFVLFSNLLGLLVNCVLVILKIQYDNKSLSNVKVD